jgi:ankyrin repeat protein
MITSGLLLGRPRSSNHTDAHIICVGLRDVPISVSGHEQVAKLLLDKGADVNAKGGYYGNALYAASVKGHEQVVKMLLDNNTDVNTQGKYYSNALCAASVKGHKQVVKLLLNKGADVNAKGGYYSNALYIALVNRVVRISKV